MARHTTFRFCLDPTVEQQAMLARHGGAARFGFNICLRAVKDALTAKRHDPHVTVPWTGFDLINHFNNWKKTEQAGRVFAVDANATAQLVRAGLHWRAEVCQQVFEEAAVDLGRALSAWSDSRTGNRAGRRVGFPRWKTKTRTIASFRLRNRTGKNATASVRVGDGCPRSVTLPVIGRLRVREDTRKLRRLLATGRAKVLFATVTRRGDRWWISLNVEAADLHPARQHPARSPHDHTGWVGVDRGLTDLLVAARTDGVETARVPAPKALATRLDRLRRLGQKLSRAKKGSNNRRKAIARLARAHAHVRAARQHALHQVSNRLVNTHDRIALEDLNVAGMLRNHRVARAVSDAAWAELARQTRYKQAWRGGQVITVDRWFPSSKTCSTCGHVVAELPLHTRVFTCPKCHAPPICRDLNAAINLAVWAQQHAQTPDPEARGRVKNARRGTSAGRGTRRGETGPDDVGTSPSAAPAA